MMVKYLPDGPDIPEDLISAQEKGQVLFICGAGVSAMVGLPLFKGLVDRVYTQLGEDWNLHPAERAGMEDDGQLRGQYDRVLRCLERRLAASNLGRTRGMHERIRVAVRNALIPVEPVDLSNHMALLALSRDSEGGVRLLTTNFDTLFERAWREKNGDSIPSHAGPAMPQPKSAGCTGVLHLHGRISDINQLDETDLVLTSAEFGDAYLRSGWASRYVYDLVRAYTVVLVGYQADDPPMRYLLEALEADRERYPDLQKVYAFASYKLGEEIMESALWRAKGVEPILYMVNEGNHAPLYDSVREWQTYADNPTSWRRENLRELLGMRPDSLQTFQIQRCVELLSHGDASQLLNELSPIADWLPVLVQNQVFADSKASPGQWIGKRLDDSLMIKAAAALFRFDDHAKWFIARGLELKDASLTEVQMKAWRLLLLTKGKSDEIDRDGHWLERASKIRAGETGFESRRLVVKLLRPNLTVEKKISFGIEKESNEHQSIHSLLSLDFKSADYPPAQEILGAWPVGAELQLMEMLDANLRAALEEADEVGLIEPWDYSDREVPSVAHHPQNAHRSGFFPIVRVIAGLCERLVVSNSEAVRNFVLRWKKSRFNLFQRLALYPMTDATFTPGEVAEQIMSMSDETFWTSGAQVEIMRVLIVRWNHMEDLERQKIEDRILAGISRELFPENVLEDLERWTSIHDSSIFRRLSRMQATQLRLSEKAEAVLASIKERNPKWVANEGDQDDFQSWRTSRQGLSGQANVLEKTSDDLLVREAYRLQQERQYDQGDLWRVFCDSDPQRALRGLVHEATNERWEASAWRYLLWAAGEKGDEEFQLELSAQLLDVPDNFLEQILDETSNWLERRWELLSELADDGRDHFFEVWDRLAEIAYRNNSESNTIADTDALDSAALSEAGGILASLLVNRLDLKHPETNAGLEALEHRFTLTVGSSGKPRILALMSLARQLPFIESVAPLWVETHLVPSLSWDNVNALHVWRSYAFGQIGSPRLFNTIRTPMLQALDRSDLPDELVEGLIAKLLTIGLWRQKGIKLDYELSFQELRRALTLTSAIALRHSSWVLWRWMDEDIELEEKAERWRLIIGPFFNQIWPLDRELRSPRVSQNLVHMASECDAAFPDAVAAILDVIVPYEVFRAMHIAGPEAKHEELIHTYPESMLSLANALIDPDAFQIPGDIADFLNACISAEPTLVNHRAYIRLDAIRRRGSA
jgi:NAD-dependent SIR2 family protein deacetylase